MADNRQVRDGNDVLFTGATDELSDGAHAPKIALTDGSGSPNVISPATKQQLPAALSASGNLKVAVAETIAKPATAAASNVAQATTSVSLLANNPARLGATIYNDAAAPLLLLLGNGPASTLAFTLEMAADSYYEVPFSYTGPIVGIWTAAGAGAARCTSLT
jgi:hypothetical protein